MLLGKTINQSGLASAYACLAESRRASQGGLTLVETVLALAIVTLTVTVLASSFPFGLKTADLSQEETTAVFLAQAKIEELIGSNYIEVPTQTTIEGSLVSWDPDFGGFSRTTVVSYVDGDLAASPTDLGLKKIKVTVGWQNNLSQATSTFSLIGLINDY